MIAADLVVIAPANGSSSESVPKVRGAQQLFTPSIGRVPIPSRQVFGRMCSTVCRGNRRVEIDGSRISLRHRFHWRRGRPTLALSTDVAKVMERPAPSERSATGLASKHVGRRDGTRTDIVTMGGAIALGLALGVLLAQRTSLCACTLGAQIAASVTISATIGAVAGMTAAITVAIVTPLAYLLRRIFDGRRVAASDP